jgi:pilus assembly protein CpaF
LENCGGVRQPWLPEEKYGEVRELFAEKLAEDREYSDAQIRDIIEETLEEYGAHTMLSIRERSAISREIFNSVRRLGLLTDLLEDRSVTEIMVNGLDPVYIEQGGKIRQLDRHFRSIRELENTAQHIAGLSDRTVNTASPIVDARLEDGSRVCIVLPPAAPDGPILTIRKFSRDELSMRDLTAAGTFSPEAAAFLRDAVRARYNIFISGGTGAGKTTVLNALSEFIPSGERVVTIEDSLELQLKTVKNLVRLEGRNATSDRKSAITIRDLIRASLRLRPDRIIVGEVRDEAAIDMLQAMNTGHAGSLSTGHANSPSDMLERLATMCLMGMENMPMQAVRQQIASALELIIHLGRLQDGSRRVLSISEISGTSSGGIRLHELFHFNQTQIRGGKVYGTLVRTAEPLHHTGKMHAAGITDYG